MGLSAEVTQLLKVLELGIQMRALQTDYFRTRNKQTLRDALKAETEFDRQAKDVLNKVAQAAVQGDLLP